jgi:predicted ATP-grasp superfamily ATP-dependent carboligase
MIPVVVLRGNLGALGVVRSLAGGGMPIFVVDKDGSGVAAWSRFSQFISLGSLSGNDLLQGLIDTSIRIGGRPVLMMTTDSDVNFVSAFRSELEPYFRFTLPSSEMVHKLYDKAQFQMLAEREGLSIPRGVILSNPSDLELISELNPPLVIKPADKAPLVSNFENDRPVRVNTQAEAYRVTLRMMEKAGRVAIQEWIEGADSDIYFSLFVCDSEGKVVAMFSGRKLVCDPPDVGITAICTSAPEFHEALTQLSRQFIERVGYKGIGGLEFKRDRRSGRLVITEPTVGRIDWQEEIATLCGVNLPLAAYCAETGLPYKESAKQTSSVMWRSSVVHRLPSGIAPPGASLRDGYFRLNDPLPAVYYYAIHLLPLGVNKIFRRMLLKRERPRELTKAV